MASRKLKKGKLVFVEWIDASGNGAQRWMTASEAVSKPSTVKTVGWVIGLTKKAVTITNNRDVTHANVHGDITIPLVSIRKKRRL